MEVDLTDPRNVRRVEADLRKVITRCGYRCRERGETLRTSSFVGLLLWGMVCRKSLWIRERKKPRAFPSFLSVMLATKCALALKFKPLDRMTASVPSDGLILFSAT